MSPYPRNSPRPRPRPRVEKRRGFTLVEITVVLFLVALLASVVAVSAGGMIRGATLEDSVAQLESLDDEARRTAKRLGYGIELKIDTASKQFILIDPRNSDRTQLSGIALPKAFEITDVWRAMRGEIVQDSDPVIRYEPDGTATTWGLTLTDRNTQESLTTLMVAGMTGQISEWENHEQAQTILAETVGRHAD